MLTPKDFDASAFSDFWPALNAQLALLGAPEALLGEATEAIRITKELFSKVTTPQIAAAAAGLVERRKTQDGDEGVEGGERVEEEETSTPDFTLTIRTGNDAFAEGRREEIARILIDLAARFLHGQADPCGWVRDFNGNTVGQYEGAGA